MLTTILLAMTCGCSSGEAWPDLTRAEPVPIPPSQFDEKPDGSIVIPGFASLGPPQKVGFRITEIYEASFDVTALRSEDSTMALIPTDGESGPFWSGEADWSSRWERGDRQYPPAVYGEEYLRFTDREVPVSAPAQVTSIGASDFGYFLEPGGVIVVVRLDDLSVVSRYELVAGTAHHANRFVVDQVERLAVFDLENGSETTIELPDLDGRSRDYFWMSDDILLLQVVQLTDSDTKLAIDLRDGNIETRTFPGRLDELGITPGPRVFDHVQRIASAGTGQTTHIVKDGELQEVGNCSSDVYLDDFPSYAGGIGFLGCETETIPIEWPSGELSDPHPGGFFGAFGDKLVTTEDLIEDLDKRQFTAKLRLITPETVSQPVEVSFPFGASPFLVSDSKVAIAGGLGEIVVADVTTGDYSTRRSPCGSGSFFGFDPLSKTLYYLDAADSIRLVWQPLDGAAERVPVRALSDCDVKFGPSYAVAKHADGVVRGYHRDGTGVRISEDAELGWYSRLSVVRGSPGISNWEDVLAVFSDDHPSLILVDLTDGTSVEVIRSGIDGDPNRPGISVAITTEEPGGILFGFEDARPSDLRIISSDPEARVLGYWNPWLVVYDPESGVSTIRRIRRL